MHDEYVYIGRIRRGVPIWFVRLAAALPWQGLYERLFVHADGECECACHQQPGMRECGFCRWRA